MNFDTAGIILFVRRYEACMRFYGETLALPLMFRLERPDSTLACFDLGGSYLMVEPGGSDAPPEAGARGFKLRFNVADVEAAAERLAAQGVEIAVRRHPWGATAEFADPDGNRCALRSRAGFGV